MNSNQNAEGPGKSAGEDPRSDLTLFDVLANADGAGFLEIIDRVFKAAARKASEESHALGLEVEDGRSGERVRQPAFRTRSEDRLERALEEAAHQPDDEKGLKGLRRRQAKRRRRNFIFNHVDFSKAKIAFGDKVPKL